MSEGYVYILSNPSMPGLVKIGMTTRSVEGRANELYQTGVPTPFKVEHEVYDPDCAQLEADMHRRFADCRVTPAREFFSMDTEQAVQALVDAHQERIEILVQKFMPNHMPVDISCVVDPSGLSILAHAMGVGLMDVTAAIDDLRPDELAPALARWQARLDRAAAEINSQCGNVVEMRP